MWLQFSLGQYVEERQFGPKNVYGSRPLETYPAQSSYKIWFSEKEAMSRITETRTLLVTLGKELNFLLRFSR